MKNKVLMALAMAMALWSPRAMHGMGTPMKLYQAQYTTGWTGAITLHVPKNTNLTQNPIQFTINGATIGSAWGLAGAPVTSSEKQNTVTFTIGKRWDEKGDLITDQDSVITIQFSPSSDTFSISNLKIGNKPYSLSGSKGGSNNQNPSLPIKPVKPSDKPANKPIDVKPVPQPIKPLDFVPTKQKSGAVLFSPYIDFGLNSVTGWSSEENSMQPIHLPELLKKAGVSDFHLAFVTSTSGKCEPFVAGYSLADGYGVKILTQLQKAGVGVIASFGGASGTYLEQCAKTPEQLVQAYEAVIKSYNPRGLDFDIENGFESHNPQQLDLMIKAIKTIQSKYPKLALSFTLPVLPSGLVAGNGLGVMQKAVEAGITCSINIMAMDYGPAFSAKTMGQYAIDAAEKLFEQFKDALTKKGIRLSDEAIWGRIQVTAMIGLNDTVPQNFDVNDARTLRTFAQKVKLGMISFWSVNRDHKGSSVAVDLNHTSTNPKTQAPNQSYDYEFSDIFSGRK